MLAISEPCGDGPGPSGVRPVRVESAYLDRFERRPRAAGEPDINNPAHGSDRPLIHALVHHVLPQAVFSRHPELARVLNDATTGRHNFGHFIAKAAIRCRNAGHLNTLIGPDAGYLAYLNRLASQIRAQPVGRPDGPAWLLHLPMPISSGEAYCAVIADGARPRYFTLEHTVPGMLAQAVETRTDGVRFGFGFQAHADPVSFANRVLCIVQRNADRSNCRAGAV
jgi:hypothetical protein